MTSRRTALLGSLTAFAAYALLGEARSAAPPLSTRWKARRWIEGHQALAEGLAAGRVTQAQWRSEVARLAAEVDVAQLMAEVGAGRIRSAGEPFVHDPPARWVTFLDDEGRPRRLAYGAKLFDFSPANVITPHAHRHMVSAHMVVAGEMRIRTFDRVGEGAGTIFLRASGDRVGRVGEAAAMTAVKDNVHWFVAHGGPATTFDVIISDLDPGQSGYEIQPVDVLGARARTDGTIAALILSFAESMRRYDATL